MTDEQLAAWESEAQEAARVGPTGESILTPDEVLALVAEVRRLQTLAGRAADRVRWELEATQLRAGRVCACDECRAGWDLHDELREAAGA